MIRVTKELLFLIVIGCLLLVMVLIFSIRGDPYQAPEAIITDQGVEYTLTKQEELRKIYGVLYDLLPQVKKLSPPELRAYLKDGWDYTGLVVYKKKVSWLPSWNNPGGFNKHWICVIYKNGEITVYDKNYLTLCEEYKTLYNKLKEEN